MRSSFTPKTKKTARTTRWLGIGAVAALALTACGGSNTPTDDGTAGGGNGESINIAIFNGWEEGIVVSEMWALILEDEGYDVEKTYVDLAPGLQGITSGDLDFVMDIWQPVTHEEYLEEYGDQMEELGEWNHDAVQVIAVNDDAPVDSLEDLADHKDDFNGRLVGIEPGAGLTERTQEILIPGYDLEDWDFSTSSTPAMLQELESALDRGENIAVTLYMPHWAFSAMDIRPLEDPQAALGLDDNMATYARLGFTEDHPEVAEWLSNFKMDTDRLQRLEELLFADGGVDTSEYEPVIREWMENEEPEYVASLTDDDPGVVGWDDEDDDADADDAEDTEN